MTQLPPFVNSADPGVSSGPDFRSENDSTSLWTGGFTDPALETAYCHDSSSERSRRLRMVSLLGTGFIVPFGFTDYLTLGSGWLLALCISARLFVFACGLTIVWRSHRENGVERLERNTLA